MAPPSAARAREHSPAAGSNAHAPCPARLPLCARKTHQRPQVMGRASVVPVCRHLAEPERDRLLGSHLQLPGEGALRLP